MPGVWEKSGRQTSSQRLRAMMFLLGDPKNARKLREDREVDADLTISRKRSVCEPLNESF
jgi:hypothetical protein